jgi:hypothetical protein
VTTTPNAINTSASAGDIPSAIIGLSQLGIAQSVTKSRWPQMNADQRGWELVAGPPV